MSNSISLMNIQPIKEACDHIGFLIGDMFSELEKAPGLITVCQTSDDIVRQAQDSARDYLEGMMKLNMLLKHLSFQLKKTYPELALIDEISKLKEKIEVKESLVNEARMVIEKFVSENKRQNNKEEDEVHSSNFLRENQ
ncbi:hypothetical protein ACOME3_000280 [Neoechinorhynchus agilis]